MPNNTINGVPIEEITKFIDYQPEGVERIATRRVKLPELTIVEPNPQWPNDFENFKSRILAAFEPQDNDQDETNPNKVTILSIAHVGSTSVPSLPAKAIIDIDLVLSPSNSLLSEPYYVPRLEAAGFQFLLREPAWHQHRFFVASEPMFCNLHVWGPACPEVARHRIFRDWLRREEGDRMLYAGIKREAARKAREGGETMMQYTDRKDGVVREILGRAFAELRRGGSLG